jgi:ParB family transcriptional regulator, chromosome partitioning protein
MIDQSHISELAIDLVQPNPLQPRGTILPNSLTDLVESIKEHGILEPLVIAHTPAGYQIIAGERRWRSAKIVGLKVVPVVIKETTPKAMLEMAIVENVQRTDLNPIERAKPLTDS